MTLTATPTAPHGATPSQLAVGARVRIERDETRHPSKGTWPRFRGRVGTVVEINTDPKRPHLTEYGVVFGKVRKPNKAGSIAAGSQTTWFKSWELACLNEERSL
jgi:hypothetical protein